MKIRNVEISNSRSQDLCEILPIRIKVNPNPNKVLFTRIIALNVKNKSIDENKTFPCSWGHEAQQPNLGNSELRAGGGEVEAPAYM